MRILTDCASCGHVVRVEPASARLVRFRRAPERPPLPVRLAFVCPDCGDRCDATVTARQEARLADIGVAVEVVDDPRERHPSVWGRRLPARSVLEPPPFTADDVIELHELLARDDWFERFLAAG